MLARISPGNAAIICDHILAEKTELNIKSSTAESKVKYLIWQTYYKTLQDLGSFKNKRKIR